MEATRLSGAGLAGREDLAPDARGSARTLYSRETLEALGRYAVRLMGSLGERIYAGEAAAEPARMRGKDLPCVYCAYRDVCRFDRRMPGAAERTFVPEDAEEILAGIRKEEDGHETDA